MDRRPEIPPDLMSGGAGSGPGVALWRRLGDIKNGPPRRGDRARWEPHTRECVRAGASCARILISVWSGERVATQIVHGASLTRLHIY